MTDVWADQRVREGVAGQKVELARLIGGGARRIGWKAAFGSEAMMDAVGTTAALVGYLSDATLTQAGATITIGDWTDPRLEPEVAVLLGADIAPGASRDAVIAAVSGLAPAIEMADMDLDTSELTAIVAGDIFHRTVTIGEFVQAEPPARLEISRDGANFAASDDPAANPGDPYEILAHIAAFAAAYGDELTAGDIVITGSITPPLPVTSGDYAVSLEGLGSIAVKLRN